MQSAAKHITPILTSVDGKVRTLFPSEENRLVVPLQQLILPKEFSCKLNDVMRICELIKSGQSMEPIIINDTNLIMDGKKRYYAYKRLGYKKVQVIRQQINRNDLKGNEFSILYNIN